MAFRPARPVFPVVREIRVVPSVTADYDPAGAARPWRRGDGSFQGRKGGTHVQITVNDLAALVNGQVHGDGGRTIVAAKPVAEAGPQDLTFVENERNARLLKNCRAAAVV